MTIFDRSKALKYVLHENIFETKFSINNFKLVSLKDKCAEPFLHEILINAEDRYRHCVQSDAQTSDAYDLMFCDTRSACLIASC